jgi:hypothetical protein
VRPAAYAFAVTALSEYSPLAYQSKSFAMSGARVLSISMRRAIRR